MELIKRFEGFQPRTVRLPDGGWTIGYGHTRFAREGAEVSEDDADALLRYDLLEVEAAVNEGVYTPLNQNQYDALVAFAFNVGVEAFRRSNVLRRVNGGNLLEAAAALESWRRAEWEGEPMVVDALIRRRAAEKALFLTPPDGFIAAPSPLLRPELDYGAPAVRSPARAAETTAPLDGEDAAPEPFAGEFSPAVAAAEAVSRRLQALCAEEPNVAPPVPDEPPPAEEPASSPELEPAAPPPPLEIADAVRPVEAEAAPRKIVVLDTPVPSPPGSADADVDRRIPRVAQDERLVFAPAPDRAEENRWPYVLLGLGALVAFVVGVSVVLRARELGETDLFGPQSSIGAAIALVGIAGFCAAVYFWLKIVPQNREGDREG